MVQSRGQIAHPKSASTELGVGTHPRLYLPLRSAHRVWPRSAVLRSGGRMGGRVRLEGANDFRSQACFERRARLFLHFLPDHLRVAPSELLWLARRDLAPGRPRCDRVPAGDADPRWLAADMAYSILEAIARWRWARDRTCGGAPCAPGGALRPTEEEDSEHAWQPSPANRAARLKPGDAATPRAQQGSGAQVRTLPARAPVDRHSTLPIGPHSRLRVTWHIAGACDPRSKAIVRTIPPTAG